MKKLAGIFLILFLITPFLGTYVWLQYQKKITRKIVKRQIIAGIDKNELVHLKFSSEEKKTKLRWEHAKEFEYNKQMYDIVSTEIEGDTISYWCWLDNEETILNKQLTNLVAQALGNNPQNKQTQKRLYDFLKTLYDINNPSWNVNCYSTNKISFPAYFFNYTSNHIAPPKPPPKIG